MLFSPTSLPTYHRHNHAINHHWNNRDTNQAKHHHKHPNHHHHNTNHYTWSSKWINLLCLIPCSLFQENMAFLNLTASLNLFATVTKSQLFWFRWWTHQFTFRARDWWSTAVYETTKVEVYSWNHYNFYLQHSWKNQTCFWESRE